jgi:hypothetical protein
MKNLIEIDWKKIKIGNLEKRISKKHENLVEEKVLPSVKFEGYTIPIKRFLSNVLYLTYDMSEFNKCAYNRDTDKKPVRTIIKSAIINGWIIPLIIVNKNMDILLGQYRVLAASVMGTPVYYLICEDLTPEELVALETVLRWTDYNALQTYANSDIKVAINIVKIYNEINASLKKEGKLFKKLSIPQLLAILYKDTKYIGGVKANGGITILKNLPLYDISNENINKITKIFSYAQKNCMPKDISIRRQYVSIALIKFIFDNETTLDFDRLFNKLIDFEFKAGGTPTDYYNQIKRNYN